MKRFAPILGHEKARHLAAACGLLAAAMALPTAAHAQSSDSYDARAAVIEPLSITKLSDLDFGDMVVTTGGTVVLTPTATATCSTTGGVIHSAECVPATFAGLGQSGQRVRVRRPNGRTITLTGPGTDMTVTNITIDGDPDLVPVRSNPNWERYTIGSADGTFIFRVGGTLNVNAGQLPGVYTGTFDIRLDYQ
ncbi:hypothetical protein NAP1_14438 [Erythrobacter sp. NAP1]|uniref:DUF4402 domain-containing protein n=1 Tax=Erythrobacter sp. NAP1 TaxID=237727 RepID=UPI00006879ED|nr:DUF4402 domain-containing protein [Erythrobacter sp. NAP1]EAQ28805.1 hypothetical protein NAP1_14438 [Erythrobacter sp. NAP1]